MVNYAGLIRFTVAGIYDGRMFVYFDAFGKIRAHKGEKNSTDPPRNASGRPLTDYRLLITDYRLLITASQTALSLGLSVFIPLKNKTRNGRRSI